MLRRTLRLVATLAIVVGTTGTILADEGRFPVFEPVLLDGNSMSIDGRYVLTRDVTATGSTVAIDIVGTGTETIEIDLNGFTLTGGPSANQVLRVRGLGVKSLKLYNGTVAAQAAPDETAVIDLIGGVADASDNVVIEQVKIIGGFIAIRGEYVTNFALRENIIVDSIAGVVLTNGGLRTPELGGVIADNLIRNILAQAIDIQDPNRSVTIRDNQILDTGFSIGVLDSFSLKIVGNNIEGGQDGILLEAAADCTIRDNTVGGGGGSGIWLIDTEDCLILENVSNDNSFYGIELTGSNGNVIQGNVFNGNEIFGVTFNFQSSGNVYGRNTMRGNSGGASCSQGAAAPCITPAICDEGANNSSFKDNMGPAPGC